MMKQCPATLIFVTGLALGSWVPHWLSRPVSAAPRDVLGSNNVAVDVFRNADGTWVLFADGSIAQSADLRPANRVNPPVTQDGYEVPPASAGVGTSQPTAGRSQGSPFVAVKAIPRGDMTLILFSDGSILKPKAVGPAADSSNPGQLYMGSVKNPTPGSVVSNGVWEDNDDFKLEVLDAYATGSGTDSTKFRVTMKSNIKGATKSTAQYNVLASIAGDAVYTTITLQGESSDGGKTFVYDIGAQYPGYNLNANKANQFSFSTTGD